MERHSEHPIGAAIVRAAQGRGLVTPEATDIEAVPGFGILARLDGRQVAVGAERYMDRLGVALRPWG